MISYFQFLLLPHREKEQYLQEKAQFLLSHTKNNKEVKLYLVNSFFVEASYNEHFNMNEIVVFKGLDKLQEHTEHIDLIQLTDHF
ncbi:hypothetical protein GXP67_03860 [Rhodocytophaga rosea]|uniref:Uncharacterized protein n=1 Tax=Rhodocytophaga rosea TaxID=2704465 RepID=A0A6C0GD15_9BACT|nr:hypothetical protein [Rhodocytophaga rosea]QHT65861.1 hypothetical protein GXP67_03860 [Rhodocytophaga rosea]